MNRGRLRAAVVIAVIVAGSGLAGAAIDRTWLVRRHPRRPPGTMATPEQEAKRRHDGLERMSRELQLTDAQRVAVDSIMQRTDSSLRLIRREMKPRIEQVLKGSRAEIRTRLDSAQQRKFEAWIAERGKQPPR